MSVKAGQKVEVEIGAEDSFGNAAKLDGAPSWSLGDPSLGSIVPSEDGMKAVITSLGPVGSCPVEAVGDAKIGEGEVFIKAEGEFKVIPGDAVKLTMKFGEAQDV